MIIEHNEHPIERIMDNAFVRLKGLVSADTVIGNAVQTADGTSIIPISKVTMGFLTGGGEYSDTSRESYDEYPFAGGSGAGISVSPVGFLISDGKSVKLVSVDDKSAYDKILSLIPDIVSTFTCKNKDGKSEK